MMLKFLDIKVLSFHITGDLSADCTASSPSSEVYVPQRPVSCHAMSVWFFILVTYLRMFQLRGLLRKKKKNKDTKVAA